MRHSAAAGSARDTRELRVPCSDAGATAVAGVIDDTISLKTLDIGWNLIRAPGAAELARVLADNTTVVYVNPHMHSNRDGVP